MKKNYKNKAIDLFCNHTKYKPNDIKKITFQINGYTNKTFHVICKDNKEFIIRIGVVNDWLNRDNEYYAIKLLKNNNDETIIFYDQKNGNCIKKYLIGKTPSVRDCKTYKFLKLLAAKLKELHNIRWSKKDKILFNDYHCYDNIKTNINIKYYKLFYKVLKKYEHHKKVFCHNDLSIWNIIYNNKANKVNFIDFEWARINQPYFDIANFIKEGKIHNTKYEDFFIKEYDPNLKKEIIIDFLYVCFFFSLLWTYSIVPYKNILNYRERSFRGVLSLYNEITSQSKWKL